jgi:membrane protein DedA with SNARE-associated domain
MGGELYYAEIGQNVRMAAPVQFLLHHPYAILFGIVLAEQLGVPLPSVPVLLAAGALAGLGKIGAAPALAFAVLATVIADLAWFEAGRRRGNRVLKFVCRVSLEPDSCVRRTEDVFARYGPRSLLFVKFVPGLGLMAVTLAGAFGLRRRRFLLFDLPGAAVWAGTYLALGYVFSAELERAIQAVTHLGVTAAGLVLGLVALWLTWKYFQRRRFIRDLHMDRISPEDLRRKLDAGEPIAIVDLRHRLEFEADPRTLPGALRLDLSDLEQRHTEIPRDRDVVLYCT